MRHRVYWPLFMFFSLAWSCVNALARAAARRGWISVTRLDARVVSVGNLQAGGAGKTPIVAEIARRAAERGQVACILSRGYGGAWERSGGVIAPSDRDVKAEIAGDEPALLHELCPQAWLGVGSDRVLQYEKVKERMGGRPDLVILDDGLQQFGVAKDIELIAITARRRSETLFREFSSVLSGADLVILTKGARPVKGLDERSVEIRFSVRQLTHEGAIDDREDLRLGLRPRIWLVTGVADGVDVRRTLEAEGVEIERHVRFPDHARYDSPMIRDLIQDARRSLRRIGVTGKDWMKWRDCLSPDERSGVLVFEPVVEFVKGKERWETVLWGS